MTWWHFDSWSTFPVNPPTSPMEVEFVGGPFDGRVDRCLLQPLVNIPVSAVVIDADAAVTGDAVLVTSVAKYVLTSREGLWVYAFTKSKKPKLSSNG